MYSYMAQNKFFLHEYLNDLHGLNTSTGGICLALTLFKINGFKEGLCSDKMLIPYMSSSSDCIYNKFQELVSKKRFKRTNNYPREGTLIIPVYLEEIFFNQCINNN